MVLYRVMFIYVNNTPVVLRCWFSLTVYFFSTFIVDEVYFL